MTLMVLGREGETETMNSREATWGSC
jgi:hypothetical protein